MIKARKSNMNIEAPYIHTDIYACMKEAKINVNRMNGDNNAGIAISSGQNNTFSELKIDMEASRKQLSMRK